MDMTQGNKKKIIPKDNTSSKDIQTSRNDTMKERLLKQTEELEQELMAEKPWYMKGEVRGVKRNANSLLDCMPEFEMATKQAPTITLEHHTKNIEETIKLRILKEDWDDVIPRNPDLPDYIKQHQDELPEVSQEKSKLGLGQIYERDYLKRSKGCDLDAIEQQTEETKLKDQCTDIFTRLRRRLDELSDCELISRPICDNSLEIKMTSNVPSITAEEALPFWVSDATMKTPEEIYSGKKGRERVIKGDSEIGKDDRKRLRQAKKAARRKARKAKLSDEKLLSRLKPGLGLNNPYEKRKMIKELKEARGVGKIIDGVKTPYNRKAIKSSNGFFRNMQRMIECNAHIPDDDEPKVFINDGYKNDDARMKRGSKWRRND